jgi:hypothetical protein
MKEGRMHSSNTRLCLTLLATFQLLACDEESSTDSPARIASAMRGRRELLCECGDDWVCPVAHEPRVFDCVRETLEPHVDAMGGRLDCYADELEKYAACQRSHGCNDESVESCIGGDDDPIPRCGSLGSEVNEEVQACFDIACEGDAAEACETRD